MESQKLKQQSLGNNLNIFQANVRNWCQKRENLRSKWRFEIGQIKPKAFFQNAITIVKLTEPDQS